MKHFQTPRNTTIFYYLVAEFSIMKEGVNFLFVLRFHVLYINVEIFCKDRSVLLQVMGIVATLSPFSKRHPIQKGGGQIVCLLGLVTLHTREHNSSFYSKVHFSCYSKI